MYKLIKESILLPFIILPIKCVVWCILCVLRLKDFSVLFDKLEGYKYTFVSRAVFFKSLYFNFRSLPFSMAIKCPIFLYTRVEILSTSGNVKIESSDVHPGMVIWGRFDSFRSQGNTRINNKGLIVFKGKGGILRGNEICVFSGATLEIGDDFLFGEDTMIYCQKRITVGKSLRFAYQSQMFDTDFHYSMNILTGEVQKKERPIIIGDYNWFGNKTTVKKGTRTPHHLTVAGSYSVLSKDYTKNIPEYSIIGGIPAKRLLTGFSRLWNDELHRINEIDIWFDSNTDQKTFIYDLSKINLTDLTENER